MAIVAHGDVLVAGMLPRVEMVLHNVAVSARIRVVAQITGALPVTESKGANAAQDADYNREDYRHHANCTQSRTQSLTP